MPLGQHLKEVLNYLHHHRGERRAVLALAIACIAFIALKIYLNYRNAQAVSKLDHVTLRVVEELAAAESYHADSSFERNAPATFADWRKPKESWQKTALKPSRFDPNTVTEQELQGMGLSAKTVSNLLRYREKGGRFRQAEDLRKLYSLKPDEAAQLIPYVSIAPAEATKPATSFYSNAEPVAERKTAYRPRTIDINQSDTSAWIALPGIGSKLANRIVNFRQKLGGFYTVEQVGETYGLPDSTWQKIKPMLMLTDAGAVRKMNVNAVTMEELAQHPYVRFALAKAIVAYRTQHGAFENPEQLKRIMVMDEAVYNKLFPYLLAGPPVANGR